MYTAAVRRTRRVQVDARAETPRDPRAHPGQGGGTRDEAQGTAREDGAGRGECPEGQRDATEGGGAAADDAEGGDGAEEATKTKKRRKREREGRRRRRRRR